MDEKRVRRRLSYQTFRELLEVLRTKSPKSHYEILVAIHKTLDDYRAFGSETKSNYAKESLELLKRDEGL